MSNPNNVNVTALQKVLQEAEADPGKVRRMQRIEGEWLLEQGGPQFRAEVSFQGGKLVFESDQPSDLGGGGTRPGPLHYCFFGLVSCYSSTFATMASMMGIELKKLTARLEGDLDFSRVFGLSNAPAMEEIRITLQVESDAPRERLEEVEKLASERCPAVFALTERVNLNTSIEVMS